MATPVIVPKYQKSLSELILDPDLLKEGPVDVEGFDSPVDEANQPPNVQDHYVNLAEVIDTDELHIAILDVTSHVDDDAEAHNKMISFYAEIIKNLGFDRSSDKRNEPTEGATGVVSPNLAKTSTDLSARMMAQLYPASGPTRVEIVGKPSTHKEAKASRVKAYMDLQQTQLIKGYRRQEDLLFTHLPYIGTAFKKIFWNGSEVQSDYVRAEDIFVPYHAESLDKAERVCHRIRMTKFELQGLQNKGFYLDTPLPPPPRPEQNALDRAHDRIQAAEMAEDDEGLYTLYEVHCLLDFPDVDGEGPNPYVLTYDKDTKCVLRLSRNWAPDDDLKTREECFAAYILMPWRGVYGLGLYHQLGGLSKTATDSLRALLDAAKISNTPMGFRLKSPVIGATSGNELRLAPYQYAEVDASGAQVTDIRQVIMNLPFAGPNPTLFELLKYIDEQTTSFANINMQLIADSTNTGPVGTTFALIEESAKVFNSIFSRVHDSKRRELQIIHRLNHRHLNDQQTVATFGGELIVSNQDFDEECDVLPTSDPNVSSNAQRVAQLQAISQMAQMLPPGIIDMQKLVQRGFDILGMTDFEDLLVPQPPPASPRDAVGNVQAILSGLPVDAFPDQDPDQHLAVYLEIMQSPLYGANPLMAPILNPPLMKLMGAFLKFRLGKMYGHAVSGNPQMPAPLGLALPNPQQASAATQQEANNAGFVLAADKMLAAQMLPIVQKAMALVPPPAVDPLIMSAKAEQDSVEQKREQTLAGVTTKAAEIQSQERIAEMNANQATDRAIITALKVPQPPTPTAFTPEGVLPENVPDPIQQIAGQLWQMIQNFAKQDPNQGISPMAQPPQGTPAQPLQQQPVPPAPPGQPGAIAQQALNQPPQS